MNASNDGPGDSVVRRTNKTCCAGVGIIVVCWGVDDWPDDCVVLADGR